MSNTKTIIITIFIIILIIIIVLYINSISTKKTEEEIKNNVKADENNMNIKVCAKDECPAREIVNGKPTNNIICVKKIGNNLQECQNFDKPVAGPSLLYTYH